MSTTRLSYSLDCVVGDRHAASCGFNSFEPANYPSRLNIGAGLDAV